MNRVIIGSSNVYRYYKKDNTNDFNDYIMVKCTDMGSFNAIMANIGPKDKVVIVSVLENFLDKAGSGQDTEEGYTLNLGETFDNYCKIINAAASRLPGTKFAVADPIWRPKLPWYQELFDDIILTCKESLPKMMKTNVTRIEAIPEGCQQFLEDQVHLTEDSAKIFIDGLIKNSEIFFRAPFVDLGEEESSAGDEELDARVGRLEGHVRARQANDNLIFARLREESDAAANKAKEDRVVITGITSKTVPPTDPEQRKIWIKKIAMDIFESLIPECNAQIHFVNQAKNKGTHIPLIEVKLDSTENAAKIRKAFAEKKKAKVDLGRIFISNSVGLSTRVRVDILKAIARKISNSLITAHVVAFISRPVMHVKSSKWADNIIVPRTFTFVDAVAEYGHRMEQIELADAYRRAGTAFKGQMEQVFVILREREDQGRSWDWQHRQHQQQPEGEGFRKGKKRQREDEDAGEGTSWSGGPRGGHKPYRGAGHKKYRGSRKH
jgi:hypothetical protein